MEHQAKSIRPFIGSIDFNVSRNFYRDLGFIETILSPDLSVFKTAGIAFYLQNSYVKDWVDNTMIFLEVEDIGSYWSELSASNLPVKYQNVKLTPIKVYDWGRECFIHDPSGILWHFGQFN